MALGDASSAVEPFGRRLDEPMVTTAFATTLLDTGADPEPRLEPSGTPASTSVAIPAATSTHAAATATDLRRPCRSGFPAPMAPPARGVACSRSAGGSGAPGDAW